MMMNKTIKALYNGEIRFYAEEYPTDHEYLAMKDSYNELQRHLADMLDEHGQDLLDELLNLRTSMDSITDVNDFIDGFRLGARLMLEAIYDDAEEA